MPGFRWYAKRLRVMSGAELFYRFKQLISVIVQRVRYQVGIRSPLPTKDPAKYGFCNNRKQQLPTPEYNNDYLQSHAVQLLRGELTIAGATWRWDSSPEVWYRAPDTGRTWPKQYYGTIPYREGVPFGDIRLLWEPSRLQQIVDLAVLSRTFSGVERQRAVLMASDQLTSWAQANPPLLGPHYISAMECALRVIAVCHAFDIIRDDNIDLPTWQALVAIVESHAPLIAQRMSKYSSTGNHTVAESAGLIYSGLLFPEINGAKSWLVKGLSTIEGLAKTQALPDGGGVEQSMWYHQFNIHLFTLVVKLLRFHCIESPPAILAAIQRGNRFLAAFRNTSGKLPSIGDSDDGHALSKYYEPDDSLSIEHFGQVCTFENAGYTVVRLGGTSATRLVFDHGPLGKPPANAHGHADAMNLLMQVNDSDVLIDTGTYTYTGHPKWRRYFRGTAAHNTVIVDDCDQAVQESCFLWSKPFQSQIIESDISEYSRGRLIAEHDGYCNIGVRHIRGICWAHGAWILVFDRLTGTGRHKLDLHWHLAQSAARIDDRNFDVTLQEGLIHIECQGGETSLHSGELAPPMGWQSRSYGSMNACTTIRTSYSGELPHLFTTMFILPGGPTSDSDTRSTFEWLKTWLK